MKVLFAPMEGVTGRVFRRVHADFYPGIDAYYAPFFSPSGDHHFPLRCLADLLPEENPGLRLIPQLLTNRAADFVWAAASLADRGYGEVNLNLGCPSGTVVAKKKGAGFLPLLNELDAFFEGVFSDPALNGVRVSVKTRLGLTEEGEFPALLEIYRKYPLSALIVHPRIRTDWYRGPIRPEGFRLALEASPFPVIWNGDVFTPEDLARLSARFPDTDTVMLGRGLIAEPGLHRRIASGEACERETLREFHNALCEEYRSVLYGDTALCHRMKELWAYLITHFDGGEKHFKRLTKAKSLPEYRLAAEAILAELPLLPDAAMESSLRSVL